MHFFLYHFECAAGLQQLRGAEWSRISRSKCWRSMELPHSDGMPNKSRQMGLDDALHAIPSKETTKYVLRMELATVHWHQLMPRSNTRCRRFLRWTPGLCGDKIATSQEFGLHWGHVAASLPLRLHCHSHRSSGRSSCQERTGVKDQLLLLEEDEDQDHCCQHLPSLMLVPASRTEHWHLHVLQSEASRLHCCDRWRQWKGLEAFWRGSPLSWISWYNHWGRPCCLVGLSPVRLCQSRLHNRVETILRHPDLIHSWRGCHARSAPPENHPGSSKDQSILLRSWMEPNSPLDLHSFPQSKDDVGSIGIGNCEDLQWIEDIAICSTPSEQAAC